jgi:glutamine synthetase
MKDLEDFRTESRAFLKAHRELTSIRAAICDLNGCMRGKRLPIAQAAKALSDGMRMPISLATQDVWGRDIEDNPLVWDTGDADGICLPTGRAPLLMDWLSEPTAFLPMWFFNVDGSPCMVDPRQGLNAVLNRFAAKGLKPVVAIELEFYLLDATGPKPAPPVSPITRKPLHADNVLSVDDLDHFDKFFSDVYRACALQDIYVDTAIAEGGPGQFEINFEHVDDPLKAADDAVFFKRLVKGIARKHGLAASFMAKPFPESTGSGQHVHFSLLDNEGRNVFDNGGPDGTDTLGHAVAGLLNTMEASTLVFAPHLNSYRRLQPDSHAPTAVCWAYENRTAAIRIPGGNPVARRIEHRVAGADANPYLVLASLLGSALDGIEKGEAPPPPITGDAYERNLPQLPTSWGRAIDWFEEGAEQFAGTFDPLFSKLYALCKRQEWETFGERMSEFEVTTYLEVV